MAGLAIFLCVSHIIISIQGAVKSFTILGHNTRVYIAYNAHQEQAHT
jgi:hypothetical protein